MADPVALVLRFFHIAFGIAWIGAMMYGVGVLRRALAQVEMSVRKETMRRLIPILTQYLPGSAAMTILFGFVLYLWMGAFDPAVLVESSWGRTLLAALVLALIAFGIGIGVGVRGARGMLVHLNEEACTHGPEVAALQKRFNMSQFAGLGLGLLIVALMVVATERVF
jgi:uncharacterized membrane protein